MVLMVEDARCFIVSAVFDRFPAFLLKNIVCLSHTTYLCASAPAYNIFLFYAHSCMLYVHGVMLSLHALVRVLVAVYLLIRSVLQCELLVTLCLGSCWTDVACACLLILHL